MSKLKMVQGLPSGGAEPNVLQSVVEVQHEVRQLNEASASLLELPKELEGLIRRERTLQKGIFDALTAMRELRDSMKEDAGEQAKVLENQNTQVMRILARQQEALNKHLSQPNRRELCLVAVTAVVAVTMALNFSPVVNWAWSTEERARDRNDAQYIRETLRRMSPMEQDALLEIRNRPFE